MRNPLELFKRRPDSFAQIMQAADSKNCFVAVQICQGDPPHEIVRASIAFVDVELADIATADVLETINDIDDSVGVDENGEVNGYSLTAAEMTRVPVLESPSNNVESEPLATFSLEDELDDYCTRYDTLDTVEAIDAALAEHLSYYDQLSEELWSKEGGTYEYDVLVQELRFPRAAIEHLNELRANLAPNPSAELVDLAFAQSVVASSHAHTIKSDIQAAQQPHTLANQSPYQPGVEQSRTRTN